MADYNGKLTGAQIDALPDRVSAVETTTGNHTTQLTDLALNLGDPTKLETSDKTSAVVAINELNTKVTTMYQDYIDASTLIG